MKSNQNKNFKWIFTLASIVLVFSFMGYTMAQSSVPYAFSNGQVADAEQINANFSTIANQVAPIGAIIPWHKNILDSSGVPLSLPQTGEWVECNGQIITINGYTVQVPDLNGNERFVRGGLVSGVEQEENDHYIDYMNTGIANASYGHTITPAPGETTPRLFVGRSSGIQYPMEVHVKGGDVRPINISMVWIMRVK